MIGLGALWELATSKVGTALIGAVAAIALLVGVYQAGKQGERARGEAAGLRARLELREAQIKTSIEIQTKLAASLSEIRYQNEQQGKLVDEMVEDFKKRSPGLPDALSPAERVRLRSIRIGRQGAAPAAR